MKKTLISIAVLFFVLLSGSLYSITNFNCKGIALNNVGQILPNTVVDVQVTISTTSGGVQYQETHGGITTDQFGGFVVEVGTGTVVRGASDGITTTADTRIKVETRVGGGTWVISSVESLSKAMDNALNNITDFAWGLKGNAGTTAGTDFVGTTDGTALELRVDDNNGTYFNKFILGANYEIYRESNDSTVTGNARGINSVDMQAYRDSATQVASGRYSVIGGGGDNTCGGWATVSGGWENNASGVVSTIGGGAYNTSVGWSTIGGGWKNYASGIVSTIGGGAYNTAGYYATVGGGEKNTASGDYSTIPGGFSAKADKYGQNAYASGSFANNGDAQTSVFVVRRQTNNASATVLYLDGSSKQMTIPANTSWAYRVILVARSASNHAAWEITGLIDPSNLGSVNVTAIDNTVGWTNPSIVLTGGNMQVSVQGNAGTTIRWVARVEVVEVGL